MTIAMIVAMMTTAGNLTAQTVDETKKIVLTVKQGEDIILDFQASSENTKVRIVSGSNTQEITTSINWTGAANYQAGGTTMTIIGAVTGFNCNRNGEKITAIDVSGNTALTKLYCYRNELNSLDISKNIVLKELSCFGNKLSSLDISHNTALTRLYCHLNQLNSLDVSHNTALEELDCSKNQLGLLDVSSNTALTKLYCNSNNFTTQAFNDLMCSLPTHQASDAATFYPLLETSDTKASTFQATNSTIAKDKNWKVRYLNGDADIPATTGSYVCPMVDESKKIVLTVKQGQAIRLKLQATAENTKVKIVSGDTQHEITAGTEWTDYQSYQAEGTTMTISGEVTGFDCIGNRDKITGIDISGNNALTVLSCFSNKLSSLDVSKNIALTVLSCSSNQLSSLDVSKNIALKELSCGDNKLSSLDVSNNTALTMLYCHKNQLSSLDISHNTALTKLSCYENQLNSLDVSKNTALEELSCYSNNFTTQAFDDLMCSLPIREASDGAKFYPLRSASDSKATIFQAANSTIAKDKNWKVIYRTNSADIPATTGTYVCPSTLFTEASTATLSLYPNPVEDVLQIETGDAVRSIRIYNVYGTEVATATNATAISLAHLPAGVYVVRVVTDKGIATLSMIKK